MFYFLYSYINSLFLEKYKNKFKKSMVLLNFLIILVARDRFELSLTVSETAVLTVTPTGN